MSDAEELASLMRRISFSLDKAREHETDVSLIEFLKQDEPTADAERFLALVAAVDRFHRCTVRVLHSAFLFHTQPASAGRGPYALGVLRASAVVVARFERLRAAAMGDMAALRVLASAGGIVGCMERLRANLRAWHDFELRLRN